MSKPKDYTKLKELLESQETFPLSFTHKFIGRNTGEFKCGVEQLEKGFPKIRKQAERASSGGAHLAMTYVFQADSADEIILLMQATGDIEHLVMIL